MKRMKPAGPRRISVSGKVGDGTISKAACRCGRTSSGRFSWMAVNKPRTSSMFSCDMAGAVFRARDDEAEDDGRGWVRTSDLARVKGDEEGADPGVNPVDKPDSGDG